MKGYSFVNPKVFGHGSRWLINKSPHTGMWLLHEPITRDSDPPVELPTFAAAVALFIAYTQKVSTP